LGGAAIARVTVGAYGAALDVCDRPRPEDPYSAKFSLQHCVAVALSDGRVDQASFNADARKRVADERAKVDVELSGPVDSAYPRVWGVEVSAALADGRILKELRRDAKGDPEDPVTAEELSIKSRALLIDGGMKPADADAFIAEILDLANDRPVKSLALFMRDQVRRLNLRSA
jgi:2-methylcitrate dehydratase PrpD